MKCKYCDLLFGTLMQIEGANENQIFVDMAAGFLRLYDTDSVQLEQIKINYCPMCGKQISPLKTAL